MKKLLFLFFLTFGITSSFAQENFDVSTLRIGAFTIHMKAKEVEKVNKSKLVAFNGQDDYQKTNKVNYAGETIEIIISQTSDDKGQYDGGYQIFSLMTKSKKFRTKSGMGVGSTKDQLFEAYKNYPNFSVTQMWDEKTEKFSTTRSNFTLTDNDAGTLLSFTLINNVVTEISVYLNEGC
ncbi:hypothetical protein [Kaistella jeonii]|uniref:Uncharacterized protein n=1 Tax=Kaistella jeonii TaxID=266749 RepID=A0A0C1F6F7_9FLAO|nr:hypothetical protein [Kaistella jeonii]KIA88772.1 hypothetical protein OA86_08910 [Kaistella jeonii]SFC40957.1 hypothetical protein SAMN05421876_11926 [Kaistella jeonii]VEI97400.1 Uncharacterised protein [Kaistella jeonii]